MPKFKRHPNNVIVGEQGRIVIPANLRKQLGIAPGDELLTRIKDGQLLLEKPENATRRLQEMFTSQTKGRSMVDELIAERRREAQKEEEEIRRYSNHPSSEGA
ncbi:MAG: AbrB/MazE/SpoVT family DNA-binding domain-containing protein [Dehalococcoidia bacterium]